MSALPKQVQAQLNDVEAIEKQLSQPQEAQPPAVEEVPEAPSQEAAPQVNASEAVEAPQVEQPKADEWERKYRTLEGMFSAETRKLHAQVKELTSKLMDTEQRIQETRQPVEPPKQFVTEKDVEAFGEDLIDVQRRVAHDVIKDYVAPLQAELAQRDKKIAALEQVLAKQGGEVSVMSFSQQLENRIPGFARLNASPEWVAFLDGIVEETGQPRRNYAQQAFDAGDVEAVARWVERFQGGQRPQAPNSERQTELQRQVAPAKTSATNAPAEKRIYTSAEADRLWRRVTDLGAQGKTSEAAALETELTAAYMEQRVR